MKKYLFIFIMSVAILAELQARADTLAASAQVNSLDHMGISARAIGMGSTFVAVADDSSSLFWNPAGLANMQTNQIAFHHNAWLADINQETIDLGVILGPRNGVGLSVNSINYGTIKGYDDTGISTADYSATRTGLRLGWAGKYSEMLMGGFTLNGDWQSIADTNYSSFSADLGILVKFKDGLNFGVSYANLGPALAGNTLATTIRLGISWRYMFEENRQFLIAASESVEPGGINRLQLGTETRIFRLLVLRAGYQASLADTMIEGFNGLTLGFGTGYGALNVDYAFLPFGDLGITQRISLSCQF